jgi:hypothetical protein
MLGNPRTGLAAGTARISWAAMTQQIVDLLTTVIDQQGGR